MFVSTFVTKMAVVSPDGITVQWGVGRGSLCLVLRVDWLVEWWLCRRRWRSAVESWTHFHQLPMGLKTYGSHDSWPSEAERSQHLGRRWQHEYVFYWFLSTVIIVVVVVVVSIIIIIIIIISFVAVFSQWISDVLETWTVSDSVVKRLKVAYHLLPCCKF